MVMKFPRKPPTAVVAVADRLRLPAGPEEVVTIDAVQKGQDSDFDDVGVTLPVLSSEETVVDFDTMFRNHHTQMASLVTDQAGAALTRRQVASPKTAISSTGVVSFNAGTASVFDALKAPRPQMVLSCLGFIKALDPVVKLPCIGNILSKSTDQIALGLPGWTPGVLECAAAVQATAADQTEALTCNGQVATSFLQIVSFRWSDDLVDPIWTLPDGPPTTGVTIEEETVVLLAIRVKLIGTEAVTDPNQKLAFEDGGGTWLLVADIESITLADPVNYVAKSNGSAVAVHEFVCNTGGGTKVPGVYTSDVDSQPGLTMNPGEEAEFWFAVRPQTGAAGTILQFRLSSVTDGIEPDTTTFIGGVEWTEPVL